MLRKTSQGLARKLPRIAVAALASSGDFGGKRGLTPRPVEKSCHLCPNQRKGIQGDPNSVQQLIPSHRQHRHTHTHTHTHTSHARTPCRRRMTRGEGRSRNEREGKKKSNISDFPLAIRCVSVTAAKRNDMMAGACQSHVRICLLLFSSIASSTCSPIRVAAAAIGVTLPIQKGTVGLGQTSVE